MAVISPPRPRTEPTTSAFPADKLAEAIDACRCIRSGDTVFIGSGCAAPTLLIDAMAARAPELHDVEVIHILTFGPAAYMAPEMANHFRHNAFFTGVNARRPVNEGRADYTPVFLGEIPGLFLSWTKTGGHRAGAGFAT